MSRLVCGLVAVAACLLAAGCLSPSSPTPIPPPSPRTLEEEQTPAPALPSGRYTETRGYWSVTYGADRWQPDPEDDSILHHASLDCGLVLAGWPMGMEGPEAEFFEMREQQVPMGLGDHVFQRSILAAKSDQAPYSGEIAYYLSQGEVFAHIVLVLGKELYDKPEEIGLCQEDAEAVVSTLSTE
jgi:hypothetical protein